MGFGADSRTGGCCLGGAGANGRISDVPGAPAPEVELVFLFLRGAGGAFGSLGLRVLFSLGASVLVAELSALFFGLLLDPGLRPGLRRGGFSAELTCPKTPTGLTVILEFALECELLLNSCANCADGDPGSGLDRGGEDRPLAELSWGEPRATPDTSRF